MDFYHLLWCMTAGVSPFYPRLKFFFKDWSFSLFSSFFFCQRFDFYLSKIGALALQMADYQFWSMFMVYCTTQS